MYNVDGTIYSTLVIMCDAYEGYFGKQRRGELGFVMLKKKHL